jgi:transmembrane sensor
MKAKEKIEFELLLRNEEFIKDVKEVLASKGLVENMFAKYPDQETEVRYAFEFVRISLSDQKEMNRDDAFGIRESINSYAKTKSCADQHSIRISMLWKAAAVILIAGSASFYAYHRFSPKDGLAEVAKNEVVRSNIAAIILSDGSTHLLGTKESQIEYSPDGGNLVIKGKDLEEEKLQNSQPVKDPVINQLVVPYGNRHSVTLSDGTKVQLNSGSRLVFPAEFVGDIREVFLKGEGYFEVSKNERKPFIVKTEFFDIKVLGTVFNISAYEDEKTATTVLAEGSVLINQKNKLFGFTENRLKPGEGYFYSSSTHTSEIRNVDLSEFLSWKDGIYLFKDQPLINIVGRINRYYKKETIVEGEGLANTLISGKLVLSDSIEVVIRYLAKTSEARFETTENGQFKIRN